MKKLIEPKSIGEDAQRREYILNVILILSISALAVLGATLVWNYAHVEGYAGMHPLVFGSILLFYVAMLLLSRRGSIALSTSLLVASDVAGTLYVGWHWGASLPETLLLAALTIVTASVLIGSTAGFATAGSMMLGLALLAAHESIYLNVPDWRYEEINTTDVITYSVMFLFISLIAWLSNRETDRSLERARRSERLLEMERDSLEQKIAERTRSLIAEQERRLAEHDHAIRIGELSRGIIHDMMNPLSAIWLCIEQMRGDDHDSGARDRLISKATDAARRMKEFMESARKHIGRNGAAPIETTNLIDEIDAVKDILAYKARIHNVSVLVDAPKDIEIDHHPLFIHRILINLVSNAIDACGRCADRNGKTVVVSAKRRGSNLLISITDNGCGMSPEKIKTLFSDPRSSEPSGLGIGLVNARNLVTKEIGGTISVRSDIGSGTTFIIDMPIDKDDARTRKSD